VDHSGTASPVVPAPTSVQRERARGGFFAGVGFLGRGFRMYGSNPGLMVLGLLPALISFAALVAAFVAMLIYVDNVVSFLTPYASGWPSALRDPFRVVAGLVLAAGWVVLSVLGYVALTLIIGQPFYEAISKRVEDRLGGVPGAVNVSFWKMLPRTIGESLRLAVLAIFVSILVFPISFIPVVGEVAAFAIEALLAGWLIAVELTSVAFARRGLHSRDRRRMLRRHRLMSLGFGAATFISFWIPFGAVIFMPAAVAGGTLMSRRILGPDDSAIPA
jgi:CysZ protein